jgi:hypothetical protein
MVVDSAMQRRAETALVDEAPEDIPLVEDTNQAAEKQHQHLSSPIATHMDA